jgi:hypothetical protein
MSRITEDEVAKAVEAVLKGCTSGRATIKELVAEIPKPCFAFCGRFEAVRYSPQRGCLGIAGPQHHFA